MLAHAERMCWDESPAGHFEHLATCDLQVLGYHQFALARWLEKRNR
jgi:hypothetical protein